MRHSERKRFNRRSIKYVSKNYFCFENESFSQNNNFVASFISIQKFLKKNSTWNDHNRSRVEFFSRGSWTSGSAQQSNMYGMMPCKWCIYFWGSRGWYKHNSLPLWPIQPSSTATKELHGLWYFKASLRNLFLRG